MTRMMALGCALAMWACGGAGSGGQNGSFSCDIGSGMTHTCTEYDWSGGAYSTSALSSSCTQGGGTAGTDCPSGSIGGCKLTSKSGATTVNTTSWYYTGQAATYMMACTQAGGTFTKQ